jgi:hypothetical protein
MLVVMLACNKHNKHCSKDNVEGNDDSKGDHRTAEETTVLYEFGGGFSPKYLGLMDAVRR